jgi:hypothetical protein
MTEVTSARATFKSAGPSPESGFSAFGRAKARPHLSGCRLGGWACYRYTDPKQTANDRRSSFFLRSSYRDHARVPELGGSTFELSFC